MTASRAPIEAKVAEIISTRSLVLNVGRAQGVSEGMVFAILNRKGEHIIDPDTKADLGSLRLPKVRVRIALVQEKFSVARTYRTLGTGVSITNFTIPSIFLGGTRTETLRATDSTAEEDLDESGSFVKVGDPAIEIFEEPEKPKEGQKHTHT